MFKILEFKKLDEDSQIEIIEDLEFDEEATHKWELFKSVLKCKDVSDLTRIEILNVLGASDIPIKERKSFTTIILEYINKREEDITFLSHCVMSLQNNDLFSEKMYNEILNIFLDPKEDKDLRFNADVIISNNTKSEKLIEYYQTFIKKSDSVFSEHSERWINEINEGVKKGLRRK